MQYLNSTSSNFASFNFTSTANVSGLNHLSKIQGGIIFTILYSINSITLVTLNSGVSNFSVCKSISVKFVSKDDLVTNYYFSNWGVPFFSYQHNFFHIQQVQTIFFCKFLSCKQYFLVYLNQTVFIKYDFYKLNWL